MFPCFLPFFFYSLSISPPSYRPIMSHIELTRSNRGVFSSSNSNLRRPAPEALDPEEREPACSLEEESRLGLCPPNVPTTRPLPKEIYAFRRGGGESNRLK